MISKILLLAGVVVVVQGTFICPPREIYTFFKCGDKCSDMRNTCTAGLGCTCIPGYKRNDRNRCIPIKDCCTKVNEKYCPGSGSDRICNDILPQTIVFPPYKNGRCCCIDGTVRDGNNMCVPESDCYQCDGQNEEYRRDGCDSVCNQKGGDVADCPSTPGCYCKPGYVRQNPGDKDCVLQSDCSCPENECYMASGGCEKDCGGNNCLECPGLAGCYCNEGYVRDLKDPNQPCILPKRCKKHCTNCGDGGVEPEPEPEP